MRKNSIKIESLEHIVLTIADRRRSCDSYADSLGMEEISFGSGRKALKSALRSFTSTRLAESSSRKRPNQRRARSICVS